MNNRTRCTCSSKTKKMKNLGLIVLLFVVNIGYSQKAETVYSIAKEQRPIEWYQEQEAAWFKILKKDKKNAIAWNNYYESKRAQWILGGWRTDGDNDYKTKLDSIVKACYASIPESFEANYMMYRHFINNGSSEYFKYLEKAYEIDPLDTRTYENFITHYKILGDEKSWHFFEEKYFNANLISSAVYNWGYNLLAELDQNAIVFTAGDNDTYSLWTLQSVKKFRPDVTVINTSLMLIDAYRIRILNELGIETSSIRFDSVPSTDEFENRKNLLFTKIFTNSKAIPVYVSASAVFQFEDNFGEKLFLTGLSYRYSEDEIDNVSLIRRNYEKRYLLDYLTMTFAFNIQDKIADNLNSTYLPAFVKLYKHYSLMEDFESKAQLLIYLKAISEKTGQYETIMELISDC